ncbi:MAG: two-component sensor histidine kinase [Arcobacter sp.]|nr:MAG: two-component sensor histidine kinase [Arcobacter sp.]
MSVLAFSYYENKKELYFNVSKTNAMNMIRDIKTKISFSHKNKTSIKDINLLNSKEFSISLYNAKKEKIFGNFEKNIALSENLIFQKEHIIFINDYALEHFSIKYILLKENTYFKKVSVLKLKIILLFLIIYSITSVLIYFLIKRFLKPLKNEKIRLSNFVKDATHELNTPITAILMSSENTDISEKQIERIRSSATRASEIYQDLSYIFLENKSEKLFPENLCLNELITEQLEYFQPLIKQKRIKITSNLEHSCYSMNKNEFIRLINNLISNSIKYNKFAGSVIITLKNNSLEIRDTGIGIEEEKLQDVFKRSFRGTMEEGGFGLGLSIVHLICKKYDIKIEINSQLKEGTSFTLFF